MDVYEFKLAKEDTSKQFGAEHQRVFNDVVRLAFYNLWRGKNCYFLMCGKYEDFNTFFVGHGKKAEYKDGKNQIRQRTLADRNPTQEWNPQGLYKEWFGFKPDEEKTITFSNSQAIKNDWGLKSFIEEYRIRPESKLEYPDSEAISVKTTCIAITPPGTGSERTHAAGIWKIEGCLPTVVP